VIQDELDTYKQ